MAKETKVMPFVPVVGGRNDDAKVAAQLEQLIRAEAAQGWEFVGMEHAEGQVGCFGVALSGQRSSFTLAVFQR